MTGVAPIGPAPLVRDVWDRGDLYAVRREAGSWIRRLGFAEADAAEIDLVVSELAHNLLEHANGGMLRLDPLGSDGRVGLELLAIDAGPGIQDVDRAAGDGFTTAGSLGYGLGTVHRLMDEVDISSSPGGGTRITCTRWVRNEQRVGRACPLTFGVITRPRPGSAHNGDTFVLKSGEESVLVGVIDGLGHGEPAHRAALAARNYVERHFDQPLDRIFEGTQRACRATRGVVMALARFDCLVGHLAFASIGNIEARTVGGEKLSLLVRRGVVGLNAPAVRVSESSWRPEMMLVLHSDGLSTRWSPDDFPGLRDDDANTAAVRLFRELAKTEDDATVVVVKGTGNGGRASGRTGTASDGETE